MQISGKEVRLKGKIKKIEMHNIKRKFFNVLCKNALPFGSFEWY
jgi:hypothetical protein